MLLKNYKILSNTLVYNSEYNTAQNPILMLYYGQGTYSRIILKIDLSDIIDNINNGTFSQVNKLKHTLKLFNTCKYNEYDLFSDYTLGKMDGMIRASNFNLVLFETTDFNVGKGYDYPYLKTFRPVVSTEPSNWKDNGLIENHEWEGGIIGEEHVIATIRSFETGFEDIDVDLTDYISAKISEGKTQLTIGIRFENKEELLTSPLNYVGFFSMHCHSPYKPSLTTIYNVHIDDCRDRIFCGEGVKNKLYYYNFENRKLTNLQNLPICTINNQTYQVSQEGIGCYSITYENDIVPEFDTEYNDIWEITHTNGLTETITQMFVVKNSDWFAKEDEIKYIPGLQGIRNGEIINYGDKRILKLISKIPYTSQQIIPNIENFYKLYIEHDDNEIIYIDWE
ncbi:MAG: hypothetical protein HUJ68_02670, partial [Clostridia bacterium]|nr:hypothetical protein [Clostridia bacterium]